MRRNDADESGHALTAFEFQPDGINVAQHGGQCGENLASRRQICAHDKNRSRAFQPITQQCRRRCPFLAGAQHIGGADIARADLAHIARARRESEHQPERDRAQEIADGESFEHEGKGNGADHHATIKGFDDKN